MKNKKILILAIVAVALAILASLYLGRDQNLSKDQDTSLKRECPEAWIENRMPDTEGNSGERQYFIINGEREEVRDYNIDWVKNNCAVQIEYVY